jgi:hypothetical protein
LGILDGKKPWVSWVVKTLGVLGGKKTWVSWVVKTLGVLGGKKTLGVLGGAQKKGPPSPLPGGPTLSF